MTNKKMKNILKLHKKWLSGKTDGVRANLRGFDLKGLDLKGADLSFADLSYTNLSEVDMSFANLRDAILKDANLSGANLRGADLRYAVLTYANLRDTKLNGVDLRYCTGNKKEIKTLQLGIYVVSYTEDILNIGCKSYTLNKWKSFSDKKIARMDSKALEWWKLNKDIVISLVEREQDYDR